MIFCSKWFGRVFNINLSEQNDVIIVITTLLDLIVIFYMSILRALVIKIEEKQHIQVGIHNETRINQNKPEHLLFDGLVIQRS